MKLVDGPRLASLAIVLALLAYPLSWSNAQPTLDRLEDEAAVKPAESRNEAGYLGLIGDDRQEQQRGIRVLETLPGGPADVGGIRAGDLVVAISGVKLRNMDEMAQVIARSRPGNRLRVSVERDDATRDYEIVMGRRPLPTEGLSELTDNNEPTQSARRRLLGIRTVPVTAEIRQLYDLPSTRGALVSEVLVGSPAHQVGIPLDAVIVEAEKQPVATPEDLARLVAAAGPGQEIELAYLTRGKLVRQKVRLDDVANAADQPAGGPASPPANAAAKPIGKPDAAATPQAAEERARFERLEARILQLERQVQNLEKLLQQATQGLPMPIEPATP